MVENLTKAAVVHSAKAAEPYPLEAVNNARVAVGKRALSKEECDRALQIRGPVEQPKVDTKDPHPVPIVDTDAQYLVALPGNYIPPDLDDGRTRTTPPTPPRSDV